MRHTGTVISLKIAQGYGFVASAENPRGVFFHFRDLAPELEFDELLLERRVTFNLTETERGPRAVQVEAAS